MPDDTPSQVGRYAIRRTLGAGGMGVVYAAYDPALAREVAVKVIREGASTTADARLEREGQAIAKLVHENVVGVYDVGRHAGRPFIAMELVEGEPLDRWLRTPRTWRETVRVFVAAGRGLAAAHAAGIVHRDFKPANVFLGADGRIKVGDFGLARAPSIALDANAQTPSIGVLALGTPLYMAPEQLAGDEVTPLADQFAFAVSLYEALYGERPFAGASIAELAAAIDAREIRPPAARGVPVWLRRAVVRALEPEPAQRYADIATLLAAIDRDPVRRRRQIAIAAGALVVAAGAGVAIGFGGGSAARPEPCAGIDAELADVWNPARRAQVAAAFRATHAPYADATLATAVGGLDAAVRDWRTGKRTSCLATARAEQTPALADLRDICFDGRRLALVSTIDALAHADVDVVRTAPVLVGDAADIARCSDLATLGQAVPPPASPAARAVLRDLDHQLADADIANRAGHYASALAAAQAVAARAGGAELGPGGYPPLRARALLLAAQVTAQGSGKAKDAEQLLEDAELAAELGRDDWTRAQILSYRVFVLGNREARYAEALATAKTAAAVVARVGDSPAQRAYLALVRGDVLQIHGDLAAARDDLMMAHDMWARLDAASETTRGWSAAREERALSASTLAALEMELDHLVAAHALSEEALALRAQLYGTDHPVYAESLAVRGDVASHRGDFAAAEADERAALAIRERTLAPDSREIATSELGIGELLRDRQDIAGAHAAFARAATVLDAGGEVTYQQIVTHYDLGSTLFLARDIAGARVELERAEGLARSTGTAHDLADIEVALAQVATVQERYADARGYLTRAIAEDTARHGETSALVGSHYDALGDLEVASGALDAAEAAYGKALALKTAALGPAHAALAITLSDLGTLERDRKHDAAALGYFQRALAIDEATRGKDHADLMWDLGGVARALVALGRAPEALPVFARALALPASPATDDERRDVEKAYARAKQIAR